MPQWGVVHSFLSPPNYILVVLLLIQLQLPDCLCCLDEERQELYVGSSIAILGLHLESDLVIMPLILWHGCNAGSTLSLIPSLLLAQVSS